MFSGEPPHERIEAIGGANRLGFRWWRAEDDAIQDIERNPESYFVRVHGKAVWVAVAAHDGRKYLKSQTDQHSPDSLLSLPDCPK
jgi:hypothetical protein